MNRLFETGPFRQKNRILLKELIRTDFKLRYQGSFLGMLWSVVKPLMLFVIMYMVFVRFLKFGAGIPHFPVSLLLAISLWNFFSEATSMGMTSIVNRGDLLRKINFPKYIIVISATVNALVNLFINLCVVFILAIIDGVQFHLHIFLIIPVLIEIFALGVAISFLLSALFVKFRDISPIWDVVLQAGFYATPIIYPISMVAAVSPVAAKFLLVINPMAQAIQDMRYLIVYDGTETVWNYVGNPWMICIPFVVTIILSIISSRYFRKNSRRFAEII